MAAELLAEEERNKAKKEKAAAKRKEKKAKKKKVAKLLVPQYLTAKEQAEQVKMEAVETELAKLRLEVFPLARPPLPIIQVMLFVQYRTVPTPVHMQCANALWEERITALCFSVLLIASLQDHTGASALLCPRNPKNLHTQHYNAHRRS